MPVDPTSPDPNIARLGALMPLFMDLINRRSAGQTMRLMHDEGLTLPQIVAMHVLRHAGPLPLQGIAEALRLSASATSVLIDRLVEKGLVLRQENPADRRQKLVQIADPGSRFLEDLARSRAEEFTAAITSIDPELRAELVTLFERVIDQLRQGESPCRPS